MKIHVAHYFSVHNLPYTAGDDRHARLVTERAKTSKGSIASTDATTRLLSIYSLEVPKV